MAKLYYLVFSIILVFSALQAQADQSAVQADQAGLSADKARVRADSLEGKQLLQEIKQLESQRPGVAKAHSLGGKNKHGWASPELKALDDQIREKRMRLKSLQADKNQGFQAERMDEHKLKSDKKK